jgi:sulfate/thiosulfate transport system substrate-binding protein
MLWKVGGIFVVIYLIAAACWIILAGRVGTSGDVILLNVACDPTRDLWRDINKQFIAKYQLETGLSINIRQSHGGSASQARSVNDGLDADLLTLALWTDTDAVRKRGRLAANWESRLPNRSLPYFSTIVMVVRKGNPKQIHDWPDLLRDDIRIITPNPKTSGNGKWSFMALWGSVTQTGGSDDQARDYVRAVFARAPVLDTSARAATMTFAQKRIGDVHLTWENEAYLEVQEARGQLEIVYPSRSILAEPHVTLVDEVVDRKGTRAIAEAYLQYLYTEEAQRIIAKHHFRPTHEAVIQQTRESFPEIKLFNVREVQTDWDALNQRFFAENGEFDQLLPRGRPK